MSEEKKPEAIQAVQTVSEILRSAGLAQVVMSVDEMKLLVSMLKGRATVLNLAGRTAAEEEDLVRRIEHQIHRLEGAPS